MFRLRASELRRNHPEVTERCGTVPNAAEPDGGDAGSD